ncbi:MAG TPA: ion channel [Telluria sp.]
MSSTGIGDVLPLTVRARAVASIEMFVGVMYLATVVARLVAFTVITQQKREPDQRGSSRDQYR